LEQQQEEEARAAAEFAEVAISSQIAVRLCASILSPRRRLSFVQNYSFSKATSEDPTHGSRFLKICTKFSFNVKCCRIPGKFKLDIKE